MKSGYEEMWQGIGNKKTEKNQVQLKVNLAHTHNNVYFTSMSRATKISYLPWQCAHICIYVCKTSGMW